MHEVKDKVSEIAREAKDKVVKTTQQTKRVVGGALVKMKEEQWCENDERHDRDDLVSYSEQWFWSIYQMLQAFNLLLSCFLVLFNELNFEPKAVKKRKKEEGEIIAFSSIVVMFVGPGGAEDDASASIRVEDGGGGDGGGGGGSPFFL
ncbi:hypothetical protein PVK06_023055 [Gossypium arboreum]|uniref:Uncharacterized protein n=1 Tax=Gossypium arboreum TaxID=29729 RepID=A0ABR0PA43_GOSAR|nr:hypothetical protein PVK06_023055 [Gossypium arboreum]